MMNHGLEIVTWQFCDAGYEVLSLNRVSNPLICSRRDTHAFDLILMICRCR